MDRSDSAYQDKRKLMNSYHHSERPSSSHSSLPPGFNARPAADAEDRETMMREQNVQVPEENREYAGDASEGENDPEDDEYEDSDFDDEDQKEENLRKIKKLQKEYAIEIRKRWENWDKNELENYAKVTCPVCRRLGIIGLKGLQQHALTSGTNKFRHRGLDLALREFRGLSSTIEKPEGRADVKRAQDYHIVWPPVVLVENTRTKIDESTNLYVGLTNDDIKSLFRDYSVVNAKPRYGRDGHMGINFVQFPPSLEGYLQAVKLQEEMVRTKRGLKEWEVVQQSGKRKLVSEDGKQIIYAYMARVEDMKRLDPQKKFVKWMETSYATMVEEPTKRAKVEHIRLEERNQLLEAKEQVHKATIFGLKTRAEEADKKISDMKQRFTQTLKALEEENAKEAKRARENFILAQNQIREKQRILKEQDKRIQQEVTKAQALEKEKLQRKKADAQRSEETMLRQEREKEEQDARSKELELELERKLDEERLKFKKEQQKLRFELNQKHEEEMKKVTQGECCICLDYFDGVEIQRATFDCQHAQTCLRCAMDLWKNGNKLCPLCKNRTKNPPKRVYL